MSEPDTKPLIVLEVWQLLLLGIAVEALVFKVAGPKVALVFVLLAALAAALVVRSRKRAAG